MPKLFAALAMLGGCTIPSVLVGATGGPAIPVGDSLAREVGGGAQYVAGVAGVATHVTYRRADETQQVSLGTGWFGVQQLSRTVALYQRLAFNLIEWDRVGDDDGAGIGGTTFELGIAAQGRARIGTCLSVSAERDFRFNDPDDTFIGINVGVCAAAPERRIRAPW